MKTLHFFIIFLVGISIAAQAQESNHSHQLAINKESKALQKNIVSDVLHLNSIHRIDVVTLADKNGVILYKVTPTNNQISTQKLKTGFYLLEAYCKGIKVKRGIIKKIG